MSVDIDDQKQGAPDRLANEAMSWGFAIAIFIAVAVILMVALLGGLAAIIFTARCAWETGARG